MNPYSLIIDNESCWGCRTCEVACEQEHDFKIKFLHVSEDSPRMVEDRLYFTYQVNVCCHCDDPACLPVCPSEAITKREDGIVILDYEKCIGCQLCLEACPYHALGFDEEKQTALKCNLCHHRVDNGLYPACADNVCLAHCIYFGDPKEIEEIIRKKKEKRKTG